MNHLSCSYTVPPLRFTFPFLPLFSLEQREHEQFESSFTRRLTRGTRERILLSRPSLVSFSLLPATLEVFLCTLILTTQTHTYEIRRSREGYRKQQRNTMVSHSLLSLICLPVEPFVLPNLSSFRRRPPSLIVNLSGLFDVTYTFLQISLFYRFRCTLCFSNSFAERRKRNDSLFPLISMCACFPTTEKIIHSIPLISILFANFSFLFCDSPLYPSIITGAGDSFFFSILTFHR